MNPREALAAIYSEQADHCRNEDDRRRFIEKAAFWLGIGNEAEAKPQTTPEPLFF